jgi:hypothetical protein
MVSVIAQYPSSRSCRARMAVRGAGPNSCRAVAAQRNPRRKVGAKFLTRAPAVPLMTDPSPRQWVPTDPTWYSWTPYCPPVVRPYCATARDDATVYAYTDGRCEGSRRGVPCDCYRWWVVRVHGFPCRASGNNYLAEMAALLAALQAVPSDIALVVHTDSTWFIRECTSRAPEWARTCSRRVGALRAATIALIP